jgi:SAM-dependent methyltransferase
MRRCLSCGSTFDGNDRPCPTCDARPIAADEYLSFEALDEEGYDEALFGLLARVEAGSFWFRARNELIAWALATYFPDVESFLEVGCGTGFVLEGLRARFPHLALSGGELFVSGLEVARSRAPDASLYRLDARRLPFTEEFDVVGSFDVLEHIEDDRAVLREIHRALRPGGGVLITVPQHEWLWSPADTGAEHVRRYTRADLVGKLHDAGFTMLRLTSFVSLLLPFMTISRLHARWRPASYDLEAELRTPPLLDAAFERVMGVERTLIRRGLSLPAGGSLLAVARRR